MAVRATVGLTAEYVWNRVSGVQPPRASDITVSPSKASASWAAGSRPESTSRRARSRSAATAESLSSAIVGG